MFFPAINEQAEGRERKNIKLMKFRTSEFYVMLGVVEMNCIPSIMMNFILVWSKSIVIGFIHIELKTFKWF